MHAQMFYSPDKTLISSLASPIRLHVFPWNVAPRIPSSSRCVCQPVADRRARRWQTGLAQMFFVYIYFFVSVYTEAIWTMPLRHAHLDVCASVCLREQVLMCVTGADSCVRGEVTPSLLSHRCLQRFVSTQPTDRVKNLYTPPHTHIHTHLHHQEHSHPAPSISLALTLTAGPWDALRNRGGHKLFSEAFLFFFLARHTNVSLVHLLLQCQRC